MQNNWIYSSKSNSSKWNSKCYLQQNSYNWIVTISLKTECVLLFERREFPISGALKRLKEFEG